MKKVIEDKIENFLKRVVRNNSISKEILLIFLIFFILILFQCNVVDMYFDDYGNASLNYRYSTPNFEGTDFTISQLFEWMNQIYNNWGGRILYAGIIIYLLKMELQLLWFVKLLLLHLYLEARCHGRLKLQKLG